ncbi:uncharacterized protein C8Q71DRAFT_699030 [Rhodofomes roseus]|uniref:Uncharacterized protein n=1 Tax=Rhodofomes roseus TaxID=34475 RepID=A0ABQ8KU65_9APHY|nr:uncharacterized protein C8Q71DRAFT_699030 [Rhodofomes roseus]KAH9842356.1 hypothetical protein C8Q71DRAFT_699030 [Rhodofomes roseus]
MHPPGCARFHSFIIALLIGFECVAVALGGIRTIDDTYGDSVTGATPTYSNAACWNEGPSCSICVSQPDPAQAHNGTWHDTQSNVCSNALSNDTTDHTVMFTFTGTTLTVYCILVAQGPVTKVTNVTFDLDGDPSTYQSPPSYNASAYGYQYNIPVYSRSSLNNTQHTFTMSTAQGSPSSPSLLLFDYATYK